MTWVLDRYLRLLHPIMPHLTEEIWGRTPHLATEERELVPFLRSMKAFPPPPNDEAVAMYAQGFAWSMQGIATDVLDRVYEMLPENLKFRIPEARVAFDARCERAWGSAKAGATRTPIPDA